MTPLTFLLLLALLGLADVWRWRAARRPELNAEIEVRKV